MEGTTSVLVRGPYRKRKRIEGSEIDFLPAAAVPHCFTTYSGQFALLNEPGSGVVCQNCVFGIAPFRGLERPRILPLRLTGEFSHRFSECTVRPALKRGRGWLRVHIERYVRKDTLDICRCRPYCTRKRYPKKNCNLLIPRYFRPEYEGLARLSTIDSCA